MSGYTGWCHVSMCRDLYQICRLFVKYDLNIDSTSSKLLFYINILILLKKIFHLIEIDVYSTWQNHKTIHNCHFFFRESVILHFRLWKCSFCWTIKRWCSICHHRVLYLWPQTSYFRPIFCHELKFISACCWKCFMNVCAVWFLLCLKPWKRHL